MYYEVIKELNKVDWVEEALICPNCIDPLHLEKGKITCANCGVVGYYDPTSSDIPRFTKAPRNKREYAFEMWRYDKIAVTPPNAYYGLDDSMPETRTSIMKALLEDVDAYLNVGQGFGQLEQSMPDKFKVCLDQSLMFLKYVEEIEIPNTKLVQGFGEMTPFKTNYFPAVVSDSVFQTLVDQREFLVEQSRILEPEGIFALTITYKWNYPRKPQDFPADNPELIIKFLDELGIEAEYRYYSLELYTPEETEHTQTYKTGDYLLIHGHKR